MTCWPWRVEMADAAVTPPLRTLSEAAVLAVAACSRTDSRRCVVTRQSFPRSATASFHVWPQQASSGEPLGVTVFGFRCRRPQSQLLLRVRHGVDQYFAAMPRRCCSVHADRRTFCRSTARCPLCCLTFELSRPRRWDARLGLAKMYPVPPTGPDGLPFALRLSSGLGIFGIRCAEVRNRDFAK